MLACDGSVSTACACAKSNRTPDAASESSAGVFACPPYAPTAAAAADRDRRNLQAHRRVRVGRTLAETRAEPEGGCRREGVAHDGRALGCAAGRTIADELFHRGDRFRSPALIFLGDRRINRL